MRHLNAFFLAFIHSFIHSLSAVEFVLCSYIILSLIFHSFSYFPFIQITIFLVLLLYLTTSNSILSFCSNFNNYVLFHLFH